MSLQSSNPRATPTHRLYVSAPESGSGDFINARGHFIKHLIKTGYLTGHCVTFLCVLSGVGLRLLLGPEHIMKCADISVQGPGHGLLNI